jgi:hypothetical protein
MNYSALSPIEENCVLLGYYATSSGNFLPKFPDNLRDGIGPIGFFRNFGKNLPLLAAKEPRRGQFSFSSRRKPEINHQTDRNLTCLAQRKTEGCHIVTVVLPQIIVVSLGVHKV